MPFKEKLCIGKLVEKKHDHRLENFRRNLLLYWHLLSSSVFQSVTHPGGDHSSFFLEIDRQG